MRRGIPERRSRAAGWARLAGGLTLPVLALSVAGARIGVVPQIALQPVVIAGFVLGFVALGLALYSLADIWVTGAEGARTAFAGIVYASPVLVTLGLVAAAAIAYPRLTDVSTDLEDPPRFFAPRAAHPAPDPARSAVQRTSYPTIVSRLYPLSLGAVYVAARDVIVEKGWTVTRDVPPPILPDAPVEGAAGQAVAEDDALTAPLAPKSVVTHSQSEMATETVTSAAPPVDGQVTVGPPVGAFVLAPTDQATIEAQATTLVFGFLDDVVVRLRGTPDGTQVDMRSASRVGAHDLGENARRIRSFFVDLDARLQPEPGTDAAGSVSLSQ
jgi:uncharacterized protein (DUF1499 family)